MKSHGRGAEDLHLTRWTFIATIVGVILALIAYMWPNPPWAESVRGRQDDTGQQSRPRGFLQGSVDVAPSKVDLSAEGTLDWIHWGYLASDAGKTDFIGHSARQECPSDGRCTNRRVGGHPQIGEFIPTGVYVDPNIPFRLYVPISVTSFSWKDGSPTRVVESAQTQIYTSGVNNGFRIQVPADPIVRTFRLYIGVWNCSVTAKATLSDKSAASFTDASLKHTSNNVMLTFKYGSATPGQTLAVDIVITATKSGGENASLSAATLAAERV